MWRQGLNISHSIGGLDVELVCSDWNYSTSYGHRVVNDLLPIVQPPNA